MSMVSDDGDYSVAGFAAASARKAMAALIAENHRLRKHLREIGLSASVCAQLSGDEEERVPWEMISNRADHALSTPSEAPEPVADNIGGEGSDWFAGDVDCDGNELVTIPATELQKLRDEREKFLWQVRDTCARAEKAEAALAPSTGDAVREALERAAKALYVAETSNHPTIHCNRFPTWEELPGATKEPYLREASAALNNGGGQS